MDRRDEEKETRVKEMEEEKLKYQRLIKHLREILKAVWSKNKTSSSRLYASYLDHYFMTKAKLKLFSENGSATICNSAE